MNWLTWKLGRNNTGYYKMLLFQWLWILPFDLYLLNYPSGTRIPEHSDVVPGYRHYRCNLILKKSDSGGELITDHYLYNSDRLKIFRSDKPHEVTAVLGSRYVLSLGVCLKDRSNRS